MQTNLKEVVLAIQSARHLLISTHQPCDGDGLGCELAFYHALHTTKKKIDIVHTTPLEPFYHFLEGVEKIHQLKNLQPQREQARGQGPVDSYDLAIIFDTHEIKMLKELPPFLSRHCKKVIFVDHHQRQKTKEKLAKILAPLPVLLYLCPEASSTGELAYQILSELFPQQDWSTQVARSLYTSIVFDTKMYRYIRNSPRAHEMAAHLLKWPIRAQEIHTHLFANQSVQKIAFLSFILKKLEYFYSHQVAFLFISQKDLQDFSLRTHESKSIIELLIDIQPVEVAITLTEQTDGLFKMSFRSKGKVSVFSLSQHFQGGGHLNAAGALLKGNPEDIKSQLLQQIDLHIKK